MSTVRSHSSAVDGGCWRSTALWRAAVSALKHTTRTLANGTTHSSAQMMSLFIDRKQAEPVQRRYLPRAEAVNPVSRQWSDLLLVPVQPGL